MKLLKKHHNWLEAIETGDHVRAIKAIYWETIRGTRINAMGMSLLYRIHPTLSYAGGVEEHIELVKQYRCGRLCRATFHDELFELVKSVYGRTTPSNAYEARIQDAKNVAYLSAWLATCDSFKGVEQRMFDVYEHLSCIAALDNLTGWFPEMELLLKHFTVRDVR
jgi:hypothetical protein